ncbi:MAG: hypothetical protein RIC52_18290 [Amphiplicatus sp.]
MKEVRDLRDAARKKQVNEQASGAIVYTFAALFVVGAAGAGFLIKTNGSEPEPLREKTIADAVSRQYPDTVSRVEKTLAKAEKETVLLAAEMAKYDRAVETMQACRRANPSNTIYEDQLKTYRERNENANRAIRARMAANMQKQTEELRALNSKLEDASDARKMLEVGKFMAGGGATRHVANMTVAMSATNGPGRIDADAETCGAFAKELLLGRHNITVPSAG